MKRGLTRFVLAGLGLFGALVSVALMIAWYRRGNYPLIAFVALLFAVNIAVVFRALGR